MAQSSCGIHVPLGQAFLFVAKPAGKSDYYANQLTSSIASDRAVISLLKLDLDLHVGGYSYPPKPEWLKSKHWKQWLESCENNEINMRPTNCLTLDNLTKISDAYDMEYKEVENITVEKAKYWWARFKR